MKKIDMIEKMKGGLIVSCQFFKDEPIYTKDMAAIQAKSAQWAGAVGIRANSPEQIKQIKEVCTLPIIGLYKQWYKGSYVHVTPTMEHVDAIVEAGADIIAVDGTFELNHFGERGVDQIPKIKKKYPNIPIFADCSCVEEAEMAAQYGAEIVATSLYGYTSKTAHLEGANFRMLAEMCRKLKDKAYVIMEGHIMTPDDAMKAVFLGAHAVVVGGAINCSHLIAQRFVETLNKYQVEYNYRDEQMKNFK